MLVVSRSYSFLSVLFSNMRALEFIALMSFTLSLVAVSIDAVLPAPPDIAQALGFVTLQHSQLMVSLFGLEMVFGELLFGPLCHAYGRRPALVLGLGLFCLGSVGALCADSIEHMGLARVLQGLGAAGPKIVCHTVVRDRFEGATMARVMSLIYTVFILVPMIAPAMGRAWSSWWTGVGFLVSICCGRLLPVFGS